MIRLLALSLMGLLLQGSQPPPIRLWMAKLGPAMGELQLWPTGDNTVKGVLALDDGQRYRVTLHRDGLGTFASSTASIAFSGTFDQQVPSIWGIYGTLEDGRRFLATLGGPGAPTPKGAIFLRL